MRTKFDMNKVTVVSALFNINRTDGRKWEEYLKWFDIFLKLKVPMVLFVTEDVKAFIDERRTDSPTEVIVQSIEDIPYQYLQDDIQKILDSHEYKENISDPDRIECQQAMYSVIQYSKFPWMKKASELNPHDSDVFFWMDAGASRFFNNFDLDEQWPSQDALESLDGIEDEFLIQMNCDYYQDLFLADELSLNYLLDNRSYILGSLFGGNKTAVSNVYELIDDILKNKMIAVDSVNNEQIALGYLAKQNPDTFALYRRTNGQHMDLFSELS